MRNLERFLFDVPLRHGLTSGTNMRCLSDCALRTTRVPHALAAILLLALCHSGWALPHHENKAIHKEIEGLEQQWRQAIVDNNVSQMDHLLADDYIGISSNGTVENKAQALAQSRAGTLRITKLDLSDLHVRVYGAGGETAVVTSLADLVGTNGASDISGEYRYTRVYNRRLGLWKIVSFEASRMNDVDARAGKK
jgi:ketosteroid isomerase-like protein